jgi:hypothetical protein
METLKEFLGDTGTIAGLSRKTGVSRRQLYYWWASDGVKRQALEALITGDAGFFNFEGREIEFFNAVQKGAQS